MATLQTAPDKTTWMVWSTRESIEEEVPSSSALIETCLAVLAYWTTAIYFETYLPLIVSAAVAPLVLLRSPKSVALGAEWFIEWEAKRWKDARRYADLERRQRWKISLTGILLLVILIFGALFFVQEIVAYGYSSGWVGFFTGIIAVVLANAVSVALYGTPAAQDSFLTKTVSGTFSRDSSPKEAIVAVLLAILGIAKIYGAVLGAFLAGVAIRITATLRNIPAGLRAMPRNFRKLAFCTSPLQEPEFVPGLQPIETEFTLRNMLDKFAEMRTRGDWESKGLSILFFPPAIFVWFFPAWVYRITLKSTAWLWWPLAFLGDDLQRAKNLDEFRWTVSGSLWARTSILLALATVLAFLASNFLLTGALFKDNPLLIPLGYFLVVDWSLLPWQILTLAVAILSIIIVVWLNDAAGRYEIARKKEDASRLAELHRTIGWIERLARLRLVMVLVLWIFVFGQALLFFNSRSCWFRVPSSVEHWAAWTYGTKFPRPPCTYQSADWR